MVTNLPVAFKFIRTMLGPTFNIKGSTSNSSQSGSGRYLFGKHKPQPLDETITSSTGNWNSRRLHPYGQNVDIPISPIEENIMTDNSMELKHYNGMGNRLNQGESVFIGRYRNRSKTRTREPSRAGDGTPAVHGHNTGLWKRNGRKSPRAKMDNEIFKTWHTALDFTHTPYQYSRRGHDILL